MAVRNLVEGQCGESNPLMRLTHHITRDKAYSDEGLRWIPHVTQDGNKGGLAAAYGIPAVDQLVEEFMSETQLTPASVPQPFRMDALLQEMREIENSRGPPLLGPAIADLTASQSAGAWAEEYLASEAQLQGGCDVDAGDWEGLETDQSRQNNSLTSPDEFLEVSDTPLVSHYLPYPNQYYSNTMHPQARMEDFVFQQHPQHLHQQNIDPREDSELARTANELLGTVDDPKFSQTEFMQFIRKLSEGSEPSSKEKQKGHSRSVTPQAASVSDQVEDSSQQPSAAAQSGPVGADSSTQDKEQQQLHERWAEEFMNKKSGSGSVEDVDVDSGNLSPGHREQFWAQLEKQWQQLAEDDELHENSLAREYENVDDNTFKPYQFTEDNPLATHPDPLSEGKRCLAAGDLPSAVLLFEAAAQQQPQLTEAWYLLGTAHAENEQDEKAIPALRKCLELSSDHGDAWMALAACYHNESLQSFACAALKEWLRSNSEYRDLVTDGGTKEGASAQKLLHFNGSFASKEVIDEVESLYLRAANSGGVAVDPWVQCGLGVIYNITMDYDRAADCYRAAIAVAPEEPRFWNKLGATLANGSHPEEAVSAYERALELSPGFIRCRFNLGIACMHMNAYKAAVEHFLSALQLQAAGRGLNGRGNSSSAVSDNIWHQLRLCLHPLGLTRLKPSVENRDLAALTATLDEVTSS